MSVWDEDTPTPATARPATAERTCTICGAAVESDVDCAFYIDATDGSYVYVHKPECVPSWEMLMGWLRTDRDYQFLSSTEDRVDIVGGSDSG